MWPFSKNAPPPPDVSKNGITARYDPGWKGWLFHHDNMDFRLSGIPFNENAFAWAREAAPVIQRLDREIKGRVAKWLDESAGSGCDTAAAKLYSVSLDEYHDSKTLCLAFYGDKTWGDFGVDVVITDGKIVDVFGGD